MFLLGHFEKKLSAHCSDEVSLLLFKAADKREY